MTDRSDTTPEQPQPAKKPGGATGKGFVKGDPRINRNGRPRNFDALRALAQQIATEDATQGGQSIIINGHKVTVIEAVMRQLAQSKNPRDRELFLKYAYGAPPTAVEVSGKDGAAVVIQMTWGDTDDSDSSTSNN